MSNTPNDVSAENEMVLMTVSIEKADASLSEAAASLGVSSVDLDEGFGLVPIDLDRGLYAVKVRHDALPSADGAKFRGPYSDPKIAPFGLSKKRR